MTKKDVKLNKDGTKSKKRGKPTTYKKKYCKSIIEYFDVPLMKKIYTDEYDKDGQLTVKKFSHEVMNDLPTLAGYAASIGHWKDVLNDWASKYEEFGRAFRRCKALQEHFIASHGFAGRSPSHISKFLLSCNFNYIEKSQVDHKVSTKIDVSEIEELSSDELRDSVEELLK